jgi:hypothetical protein
VKNKDHAIDSAEEYQTALAAVAITQFYLIIRYSKVTVIKFSIFYLHFSCKLIPSPFLNKLRE